MSLSSSGIGRAGSVFPALADQARDETIFILGRVLGKVVR
jgi:hypothetical protein